MLPVLPAQTTQSSQQCIGDAVRTAVLPRVRGGELLSLSLVPAKAQAATRGVQLHCTAMPMLGLNLGCAGCMRLTSMACA